MQTVLAVAAVAAGLAAKTRVPAHAVVRHNAWRPLVLELVLHYSYATYALIKILGWVARFSSKNFLRLKLGLAKVVLRQILHEGHMRVSHSLWLLQLL